MLQRLNRTTFSEHVHTRFRVHPDEARIVELELVESRDLKSSPRQEQFALLFQGPPDAFLPQRLYQMEHDQLGTLELFIVPVAQTESGFQYEAVFNRLVERDA